MYKVYSETCDERQKDEDRRNDPDDEADDEDRAKRYVGETSEMFKSKSLNELKPFYNGITLDDRMAEIRKSIYYIRLHWEDYDDFLGKLKTFLFESGEINFKNGRTRKDADRLLSMKRDWLKYDEIGKAEMTYEAVHLYTSKEGYKTIYGLCNRIFRSDNSIASEDLIRSVVFLVELINIDLYNYCMVCPEKKGFEGVVYRGLPVTKQDMEAYMSLRSLPIGKRNIAIPLGLMSSSHDVNQAKKFIIKEMENAGEAKMAPLLIKIHVIGLKQEYVDHYTDTFPSAVLSTICAVDIRELSRFPGESEVLLRGPFLQVLDMYREDNCLKGEPCDVLEAVMLNANRDHISTSFLGDQDGKARDLIGCMVSVTRSEFALKYCTEKGLLVDAEEYRNILDQNKQKLARLMNKN